MSRQIHIEFVGGPWDGRSLHGDSDDPNEARLARKCYWATKAGTVGQHCTDLADPPVSRPRKYAGPERPAAAGRDYVVTVHVENERGIFLRLEYADEDLRA